jgi:uncharacterized membrane protein
MTIYGRLLAFTLRATRRDKRVEKLLGVIIGATIFFIIGKKKEIKSLQYGAILAGLVLAINILFGVIGLILSALILALVYVFILSTKEEKKKKPKTPEKTKKTEKAEKAENADSSNTKSLNEAIEEIIERMSEQ